MTDSPFQVDEIVWAKIRGYPWWPAYISGMDRLSTPTEYIVNFFGDTSHAKLTEEKIAKFEENYTQFELKARTSKKLAKSIVLAEDTLKSRGIVYDLSKKPLRRPSKAHSKFSSDIVSSDMNQSEFFDPQIPQSPQTSQKESPAKKLAKALTMAETLSETNIAKINAIQAFDVLKSVSKKQDQDKVSQKKSLKNEAKVEKQAPAKESKDSKKQNQERPIEPAKSKDEIEDSVPLKRHGKSHQPKTTSNPKPLILKQKSSEKAQSFKTPVSPTKNQNDGGDLEVTISKVRQLLGSPQALTKHLSELTITTNNVKEILDCNVVEVINRYNTPQSRQVLKRLKSNLVLRYFDSEMLEHIKPRKNAAKSESQKEKGVKQDVQLKTISKMCNFIRTRYGLPDQDSETKATEIEQMIYRLDKTLGSLYRELALDSLKSLRDKTQSIEDIMRQLRQSGKSASKANQ